MQLVEQTSNRPPVGAENEFSSGHSGVIFGSTQGHPGIKTEVKSIDQQASRKYDFNNPFLSPLKNRIERNSPAFATVLNTSSIDSYVYFA